MSSFNRHKEMYCINNMMFLNHHVEQHVLYEQHDGPRPLLMFDLLG
jgi:hypothetical protein